MRLRYEKYYGEKKKDHVPVASQHMILLSKAESRYPDQKIAALSR